MNLAPQQEKIVRWMEHANQINRGMQAAASQYSKEAQASSFGSVTLNSYAFHSKNLMNSLHAILPTSEKKRVEQLFIDPVEPATVHAPSSVYADPTDKIRKRVLLSSNYATAFKVKHVV